MVIYGITYDHTTNYGSCFQAYALKRAVEQMKTGGSDNTYLLIANRKFRLPHGRIGVKARVITWLRELHRLQFLEFEKKYLAHVDLQSIRDLPTLNGKADAFVCGSDVIWNPYLNAGLDAFYLDFAEKYKFSYAASFGLSQIDEAYDENIRSKLSRFDRISVREKTSADILNRIGISGKTIEIVADPVLLLTREQWNEIIPDSRRKGKYILLYTTHLNQDILDFIEKLKKETGLKVIRSTWGPRQALKQGMLQVQKPDRWLQLLRDAEYVVTNSFHATVFSVIWHKKFFTVVHGKTDGGINVRMNDFLKTVGLDNRIFAGTPDSIDTGEIDYTEADGVVRQMREKSLAFLQENLEAAYKRKLGSES